MSFVSIHWDCSAVRELRQRKTLSGSLQFVKITSGKCGCVGKVWSKDYAGRHRRGRNDRPETSPPPFSEKQIATFSGTPLFYHDIRRETRFRSKKYGDSRAFRVSRVCCLLLLRAIPCRSRRGFLGPQIIRRANGKVSAGCSARSNGRQCVAEVSALCKFFQEKNSFPAAVAPAGGWSRIDQDACSNGKQTCRGDLWKMTVPCAGLPARSAVRRAAFSDTCDSLSPVSTINSTMTVLFFRVDRE